MKGNKSVGTITSIIYPAFALFALACFALSPRAQALNNEGDIGKGNIVEARS